MKIRSITAFAPMSWPLDRGTISSIGHFLADARERLTQVGFDVQTVRLATPPFLDVVGDPDAQVLLEYAQALEAAANEYDIDFVSIGPVVATTPLALLLTIHTLPDIIINTEKIFSGVLFADNSSGINIAAAHAFAETVHEVAHNTPNGFGNLRLAALANVPPGVPFFPAAYHQGGNPSFAIATEAADLAVDAFGTARTFIDARKRLIDGLESSGHYMLAVIDRLVDEHNISFTGIDFSLAPFPQQSRSIAAAIEKLGVESFGGSGTLFVVSFLTRAIREADVPQVGFSGIMLPVLEDDVLARRAEQGSFSVNDLLLYSAVCGTGLDTVPIPGNTTPEEMAAIFLDMGALAISAGKPLTARLMPVPGLAVGQKVDFDFEFFAPSRVLPVKNMGATGLFERGSFLKLEAPADEPRGRTPKINF